MVSMGKVIQYLHMNLFIDGKVGDSSSKKRKVATTFFPGPQELG